MEHLVPHYVRLLHQAGGLVSTLQLPLKFLDRRSLLVVQCGLLLAMNGTFVLAFCALAPASPSRANRCALGGYQ